MDRRYYTPDLANRSLPLVQRIARDVRETALEIEEVWTSLRELDRDRDEDRFHLLSDRLRDLQARFTGLLQELEQLGVELKDPFQGLLDFRAEREGREVYLCWRLGESAVDHWHELSAGFAGRRDIESF